MASILRVYRRNPAVVRIGGIMHPLRKNRNTRSAPRPWPPIAVDRRRGKRRRGGGVCQQAAEKGAAARRQIFAFAFGHEQVAPAFAVAERLIEVPAAGVITRERRPAHERGEMTHPAANLPGRGAKEERMICRLERRPRRERTLDLSRSPLVLDR